MHRARSLVAALAALVLTTGITARGFTPSQIAGESQDELAVAAASQAKRKPGSTSWRWLRTSTGWERPATCAPPNTCKQLAAAGWDAKIVTYVVPIVWPVEQRLRCSAKNLTTSSALEPAVPGDPYSRDHASIGIPYSGYSNDGDATGP